MPIHTKKKPSKQAKHSVDLVVEKGYIVKDKE